MDNSDIYDIWSAENATVSVDETDKYFGSGSVKAEFAAGEFTVYPVLVTNDIDGTTGTAASDLIELRKFLLFN